MGKRISLKLWKINAAMFFFTKFASSVRKGDGYYWRRICLFKEQLAKKKNKVSAAKQNHHISERPQLK